MEAELARDLDGVVPRGVVDQDHVVGDGAIDLRHRPAQRLAGVVRGQHHADSLAADQDFPSQAAAAQKNPMPSAGTSHTAPGQSNPAAQKAHPESGETRPGQRRLRST